MSTEIGKESEHWISALEALDRLTRVFGEQKAKRAIANRLRNGRLRVRCKKMRNYIQGEGVQYGAAPQKPGDTSPYFETRAGRVLYPKNDVELGPASWKSADWDKDLSRWNWFEGTFIITESYEPLPKRTAFSGVEFLESYFNTPDKFRPYLPNESEISFESDTIKPPKWDWESALIQLIVLAEYDQLKDAFDLGAYK